MLTSISFSGEQSYNSSSLNSKEPIFKIKKLKRKGLFEKRTMIISKMLGKGKWISQEKETFVC